MSDDKKQSYLQEAGLMIQRHQFEEALDLLRAGLERSPNDAWAWCLMGRATEANEGPAEDAIDAYRRALEIDPEIGWAEDRLKELVQSGSRRSTTETEDVDAPPEDPFGRVQYDPAEAERQQLIALARRQQEDSQFEDAKATWEKILELDPSDPWAWSRYGWVLDRGLGDGGAAEAAFRRALDEDPEFDWAWAELGLVLADPLGRLDEAEEALLRAVELDDTHASYHAWLGWLYFWHFNRDAEGEAELRQALDLSPGYSWAWYQLARLCNKDSNRANEAEAAFKKSISLDNANLDALFQYAGFLDSVRDNPKGAQRYYKKILAQTPDNVSVLWQLARLEHERLGDYKSAAKNYKTAIALNESDYELWAQYGRLLSDHLDDKDEALAALEKSIELNPDSAWTWVHLGRHMRYVVEDLAAAEEAYRKAVEVAPDYDWPHAMLGFHLYQDSDRTEDAEKHLARAVELSSDYFWAWFHLGCVRAFSLGDIEGAYIALSRAIEQEPKDYDTLSRLAWVCEQTPERWGEAEGHYRTLLEGAPESADLLATVVLFFMHYTHDYESAGPLVDRLIGLSPQDAYYKALEGRYLRDGKVDYDAAEAAFRAAIELDAKSHFAWHEWGEFLVFHKFDLTAGSEAILKAQKLDEGCGSISGDVAWLEFRAHGRKRRAAKQFKKAVAADSVDPQVWTLYGRFLELTGDTTKAESAYRTAIAASPKDFRPVVLLADLLAKAMSAGGEVTELLVRAEKLAPSVEAITRIRSL